MTTAELLQTLDDLGLTVEADAQGEPRLAGSDNEELTRGVLDGYRDELKAHLRERGPKECRWGNGYVCPHWFPESGWPAGAWWWRYVGETAWRPISGTPGETTERPWLESGT